MIARPVKKPITRDRKPKGLQTLKMRVDASRAKRKVKITLPTFGK